MSDLLAGLNPEQLKATTSTANALLIMAGAGSGKTRVLTHRIAYILQQAKLHPDQNGVRIWPSNILAITFTNKAANEMKERLGKMVGEEISGPMWVRTFHSSCVRILRNWHEKLGLKSSFTIYDTDDTRRLVKNICDELNIDISRPELKPKVFCGRISDQKNQLISAEDFAKQAENSGELMDELLAKVYLEYSKKMKVLDALDFDDLIGKTIELLKQNEDVRQYYHDKFRYIFVDEYQDTNEAQYQLIRLLMGKSSITGEDAHLTVVGDSDQSIYAFRGATIRNILDFEKDFPNAEVVLLEQNYRSTNNILKAANAVIDKNPDRKKKNLWSDNGEGEKISLYNAQNNYDEADFVIRTIKQLASDGIRYGDIAVMYRTNSLSRSIEENLASSGIPYKVIGGTKFYDRKEVKDVIAYLYAAINRDDDIHLRRILNEPKRGIGKTSEEKVAASASEGGFSFGEVLAFVDEIESLNSGTILKFQKFNALLDRIAEFIGVEQKSIDPFGSFDDDNQNTLEKFTNTKTDHSLEDIINFVITESGYLKLLEESSDPQDQVRAENVKELVSAAGNFEPAVEYDDEGEIINKKDDLSGLEMLQLFLEQIALSADSDQLPDENGENKGEVVLMTLHTAKGLEFDNVFLVGLEDGTLPHMNSMNSEFELSEERRLAYVGVTRAKKRLYISWAAARNVFGHW
ncbi:MAG: UvrD-helicase domain-containing protein, partial [Candidatus Ancillula sp.]|nr:UvrD-helicase domain-containing protein [Candidatus Ancillula sp.]